MDAQVRIADAGGAPPAGATSPPAGRGAHLVMAPWISDGLMVLACWSMAAVMVFAALRRRRASGVPSPRLVAGLGVFLALCGTVQLAGAIAGSSGRVASMPALAGAGCWAAALTLRRGIDRPAPRTETGTRPARAPASPAGASAEVPSTDWGVDRLVEALRRTEARVQELTEADARRTEFLAVLGHELRNPLAPIRNALGIMKRRGPDDPDHAWARDVVEHQLTQLKQLVDDLLEVSRVSSGKVRLDREPVDVATIVAFAVETSRPNIEAHRHRLSIAPPREPTTIVADPNRLAQVLTNLLNNAAKYTEDGGQIRLAAAREGDEVVFRVRDNGVGIAGEMLPRIFDLYAQVDRSLDRSQGGLGLGLALVRRLVELHGGSVEARSDGPGRGSEFIVRLPASAEAVPGPTAEAPPAPRAAAPGRGPAPSGAVGKDQGPDPAPPDETTRRRVLVVDDSDSLAQSMAMILKFEGYDVRVVYDGAAALELVRTFRPEAILSDLGLPGLDGYEFARRIRTDPALSASVKLLAALTGYAEAEARRRSREAGFDHHLVKPIDPEAVLALLASMEWRSPSLVLDSLSRWSPRGGFRSSAPIRRDGRGGPQEGYDPGKGDPHDGPASRPDRPGASGWDT